MDSSAPAPPACSSTPVALADPPTHGTQGPTASIEPKDGPIKPFAFIHKAFGWLRGDCRGSRSALEVGELVVPVLLGQRRAAVEGVLLPVAQLDPPDLARDRLGQLEELEAADPQVRREVRTRI